MKCLSRIVCSIGLLLGLAAGARADNTTCPGAVFLIPDGSLHEGTFTAPGQVRWFRFVAKARRSYALVSENLTPTDQQLAVGMFEPVGPDCGGTSFPTGFSNWTEPVTTNPTGGTPNSIGSARRALVIAADTQLFFGLNANGTGNFRIRVEETTMFSPAWSTNGAFDTFYSFQNTTSTALNGSLTLLDAAGVVVDTAAAPIAAGGTFSTNTVAMATARSKTGVAIFTHDGPPGAILCEAAVASFGFSPPYIQPVKCQTARQQR
jgi:hypothetical protein